MSRNQLFAGPIRAGDEALEDSPLSQHRVFLPSHNLQSRSQNGFHFGANHPTPMPVQNTPLTVGTPPEEVKVAGVLAHLEALVKLGKISKLKDVLQGRTGYLHQAAMGGGGPPSGGGGPPSPGGGGGPGQGGPPPGAPQVSPIYRADFLTKVYLIPEACTRRKSTPRTSLTVTVHNKIKTDATEGSSGKLTVNSLTIGGGMMPAGVYSAANATWIEGKGKVVVRP